MSSHTIGPLPREKVAPSDKVPPSEEVEKGTNLLYDMDNTKFTEKIDFPMHNYLITPNKHK